ncbi:MAG TPA: hypothetical protein VE262_09000 [Blastocatellia bacterium]|nr:hypothetical protein [Blastocatellia bacterium]
MMRRLTQRAGGRGRADGEEGWALLGLILALAILGITLSSTVVPNVQFQVQRDKEAEMIYRGHVMAEAIARYYNLGNRSDRVVVQLRSPMPYGYLTDLKKLRDGVTIGVNEIKFVRPSAMIDPMTGIEWEPVRAYDPRIMKVLQAYSLVNQMPIDIRLMAIAGPPTSGGAFRQGSTSFPSGTSPSGPAGTRAPNDNGEKENEPDDEDDEDDEDEDDEDDEDEDDEDEDDDGERVNDPLAHLFQNGPNNVPIVGVAPKLKGTAVRTLYGLTEYEDWVFIYIPPPGGGGNSLPQNNLQQNNQRRR